MVADFGHGFVTERIVDVLTARSRIPAVNAQTNAASIRYSLIAPCRKLQYGYLDEGELRLAVRDKYLLMEKLVAKLKVLVNADCLMATLGRRGPYAAKGGTSNSTSAFSHKVVDTVTVPRCTTGMPLDMLSFVGDAVGAVAVQTVGNKKPVEKHKLFEFTNAILT